MSCFENNAQKCEHLYKGTTIRSVSTTAWQEINNFKACREICTKCGKTVQILIKNEKGIRELFRFSKYA